VPGGTQLTNASFDPPSSGMQKRPLMTLLSGQFPDVFAGKPRPAWPVEQPQPGEPPKPPMPEEGEATAVTPAPGKLIVIGCAEMFKKNFVRSPGNMDLFLNCVDAVTLGDDLVNVRGRKPIDRASPPPSSGTRRWWKIVNYTFAAVLIASVGVVTTTIRRRARNSYTMAYAAEE